MSEQVSLGALGRRDFMKAVGASTALLLLPGASTNAEPPSLKPPPRPNILLFFTDDHGQWAQHAYGNSELKTPNLDRLAERGVRMTHAFTPCPVCSPARASLWTGRMPSQHGMHDFLGGRSQANLNGQTLLPELLKKSGYHTGLVGKWHCGNERDPHPGFDRWFSYWVSQFPHDGTQNFSDQGKHVVEQGPQSPFLTQRAIEFIQEHRNDPKLSESPFFLMVGYTDTHSPHQQAPKDLVEHYSDATFKDIPIEKFSPAHGQAEDGPLADPQAERRRKMQYYGAVSNIDREMGKIVAELDAAGQLEKTMIIYSGDHGLNCGHHGIWEKGPSTTPQNFFEESILVGCTIAWPQGALKANSTVDRFVNHTDLFATILDVANASPDPATAATINSPGRSYLPLLRGEPAPADWADAQFCEYGNARMIRTDRYKLIIRYAFGGVSFPNELYDLKIDPRETINLFADGEQASVVNDLWRRLDKFFGVYNTPEHDGLRLANQAFCNGGSTWFVAANRNAERLAKHAAGKPSNEPKG